MANFYCGREYGSGLEWDNDSYANSSWTMAQQQPSNVTTFLSCLFHSWEPSSLCVLMAFNLARVVLTYLAMLALNFGIILYENVVPETYRTLVNKLVAVMALYNMLFVTASVMAITPYLLNIPLPASFCKVHIFVYNFLAVNEVLIHNEVSLLLCLSHCKVFKVEGINEEFERTFFIIFNCFTSLFATSLLHISFGWNFFWYNLCSSGCSGTRKKV